MEFVRSIRAAITVLHEGRVLAEATWTQSRTIPGIEVYLGIMSLSAVTALNQSYGGSHTLWDSSLRAQGPVRVLWPQRMGKTTC